MDYMAILVPVDDTHYALWPPFHSQCQWQHSAFFHYLVPVHLVEMTIALNWLRGRFIGLSVLPSWHWADSLVALYLSLCKILGRTHN
jgi:hypothetical protein